jgi:hypothetical protein
VVDKAVGVLTMAAGQFLARALEATVVRVGNDTAQMELETVLVVLVDVLVATTHLLTAELVAAAE